MITKIYLFLIVSTFLLSSCENNNNYEHPIPNVIISFSVSILNNPKLQVQLQPKYIGHINGKRVGYQGHGIYIVKNSDKSFVAFDATCTLLTDINSKHHLLQKSKNKMLVYCPNCKSEFNLFNGNVQSGISKYPLKHYSVSVYGDRVIVSN